MDSGNSGSMQSSSGGDDESYDSRAESISALLGPTMTNHHHHHPPQVPQQQQQHHHRHHPHVEFDTLSNIFDSRLANPNPLLNLDMVWSKTLRSDPSMADLGGQNEISQPFLTTSQIGGQVSRGGGGGGGSSSFNQIPSSSGPNDHANNNAIGGVRNSNPKKRSRASRRAPTTVLTTDTTNFRAMVQEFTGIPAPPFTSSPFPRSRLDLFGSSASSMVRSGSGPGLNNLDPSSLPPYLLRPFAHKAPLLPSPPSPSLLASSNSSTNSNIGGSNLQQSQNLLNMNNMQNSSSSSSVLNFQSLFQTQTQQQPNLPKYPLPGSANILGPSKAQGSLGVLEDQFGLSHGLNVQLPHIVASSSSDGGRTLQARHDNNPRTTTSTMNWGGNNNNSNNKNDSNVDHQDLLRSVNGNYSNGKLNYAASSSSNVVDKAGVQENNVTATTTARSEGMVESWICSSD